MTYRDITHPNHKCSYSASCPSVSISEDGKMLKVTGKVGYYDQHDCEASVYISTDLVRDSLCQVGTEPSAVSSSPSALQSSAAIAASVEVFRETPGGSLEIMQDGCWTSIPHAAQRAIRSMRDAMSRMAQEHNQQIGEFSSARSENEKLREALKPFAAWLDLMEKYVPEAVLDEPDAMTISRGSHDITFGDLRRARAALSLTVQPSIEERSDNASPVTQGPT